MKKALCICLLFAALLLCACGGTDADAVTKVIDFTDYTPDEVMAWAVENDAADKITFVYSKDADKPAGVVIAQNVESGRTITDGMEITVSTKGLLLMGSGTKTVVPNVIGRSFSDAKDQLSSLGLSVDYKYTTSSKEKDTVICSDPLPGVSVSGGSPVVLTLSSGERAESLLSVRLEFRSTASGDNVIKVYIDGELDRSKTVCLDSSVTSKTFSFQGSGKKEVKFKVNNETVAVYVLDFTSHTVSLIA